MKSKYFFIYYLSKKNFKFLNKIDIEWIKILNNNINEKIIKIVSFNKTKYYLI